MNLFKKTKIALYLACFTFLALIFIFYSPKATASTTQYYSKPVLTINNYTLSWSKSETLIEHMSEPTCYEIFISKDPDFSDIDKGVVVPYSTSSVELDTLFTDRDIYYIKIRSSNALYLFSDFSNTVIFDFRRKYTIQYDANGGSNEPATQYKYQDINLTLSDQIPTREGYDFNGWSKSPNGDIEYFPYYSYDYTKNEAMTLYAVWSPKTYQITYIEKVLFGGVWSTYSWSQAKKHNETIYINPPRTTDFCPFSFEGWNTYQGEVFQAGFAYSNNQSLTLYTCLQNHFYSSNTISFPYTEPTCTQPGYTEGKYCTLCEKWVFGHETIPSTGHSFTKYTLYENATCSKEGTKSACCDNCGIIDVQIIENSKISHKDIDNDSICDTCKSNLQINECTCDCHKTGISCLIWKFIRLLFKILGINKVCSCGISHY